MKVLVTGGGGFIGSHLAEHLGERGDEVTVLDMEPMPDAGYERVRASVVDAPAMKRLIRGFDSVVHLAGFVRDGMRKRPYEGTTLQLQGTLNVLEACRQNDVPHVAYASSFYVYDGIPADRTVDETSPLNVLDMEIFGSAKYMGEALCAEWARTYDLATTIHRFGPVYGPGDSSAVGNFLEAGIAGRPIEVWGPGKRRNQYTYVKDVVAAVAASLDRQGETYNVITPEATTTGDLARLLEKEFGFDVSFDTSRPEGPSFPYISAEKALRDLGIEPTPLAEGVRLTAESMGWGEEVASA